MKQLTILLWLLPFAAIAQDSSLLHEPIAPEVTDEPEYFLVVENMPEFPGGQQVLDSFIHANIQIPEEAIEAGAEGRIFISFLVTTDGKMEQIKIIKDGVGFGCGEEALRVMSLVAEKYKWKPGEQRNKKVNVRVNHPIVIRRSKEAEKKPELPAGTPPQYPDGRAVLDVKFYERFLYPREAVMVGAYGRVNLLLNISKDGILQDVSILNDWAGFGIAEESVRAFKEAVGNTVWIPGKIDGKDADMRYVYPVNFTLNNTQYYCPEPDVPASSSLGDDELKQKILRKILKRYQLSPDESQQLLIIDVLITEAGIIEFVYVTYNDFDKKLATRARGAFYPEKDRFNAGRNKGAAVRSRYRMVITRQDIIDHLNHIDHE